MLGAAGPPAVVKDRLSYPAGWDRYLLALTHVGDLALSQRFLNGRFHLSAGTPKKPLAIAEALALGVRSPVDDIH
jgi:hypothetical protein